MSGAARTASAAAPPVPRSRRSVFRRLHATVDHTRYRFQQWGLAAAFGTGGQLWHRVLSPRHPVPDFQTLRKLALRFNELVDRDLANVERGTYPRELLFQVPLLGYMRAAPEALSDVPFILRRSWLRRSFEMPRGVDLEEYPRYYKQNFHWQTHGWLSRHSARIYDLGVDFLFWGATDAMRRMLLPPLVDELRERTPPPRILDVACGTGRFLSQLHAALPRSRIYGVDLSPFYVEQARQANATAATVTVAVENAEALPFDDASFDAVTSIFLFHELPRAARRNVWREMSRVAKPGARVIIADAPQATDPDAWEYQALLQLFPRLYHEPYFGDYVADRLQDALPECGLTVEREERHLVTKVTLARKQ